MNISIYAEFMDKEKPVFCLKQYVLKVSSTSVNRENMEFPVTPHLKEEI